MNWPEQWPLEEQTVQAGPVSVRLQTVKDFDALLSYYAEHHSGNLDMIPYYASLWPAARGLADFIAERYTDLSGKTVVELGCGLGLPSILAAKLGAKTIATDFHPHNREFLQRNADLNGVEIEYRTLDWSAPPDNLKADLIIGSDLIYESRTIDALANCARKLIRSGGEFILSDPGRDHLQLAEESISAAGFTGTLHTCTDIFILAFRSETEK